MAERVTTTDAPFDYAVAEPEVAAPQAPSPAAAGEPEANRRDGTGPAASERRKDRDKAARRKAAGEPEAATPTGLGGMPPTQASAAADPAPPRLSEPASAQSPAAAEPDAPQARTTTPTVEPDTAPSPATQPQPSVGSGAAVAGPPATATQPTAPVASSPVASLISPLSAPTLPTAPTLPDTTLPSTGTTGTNNPDTGAGTTSDTPGDNPDGATTTTPTFSRAQEVLDILIVLESMFGAGGTQTPGFAALESSLEPSMGSGAAAAAEYDLAVYQQNEAGAFGTLDNDLNGVLDALAGNNATYQGDMRGLILDVDARLASLGPDAYTTAGQQQAQAILDDALSSAMRICHGSQAQSAAAAAAIAELAKAYLGALGAPGSGTDAASLAEQYLGWEEPQLQGDGVDQAGTPYGSSCANFVSSMLQKAGLINWHTNLVADLATQLPAQGWARVPAADAKPGDVWICDGADGESHTEIVASNNNGQVTLIGSNNVSSGMQQVSYDSYSATIPGSYILAPS